MTNELYHYGVKGMKWGVRKAQKQINKVESRSNKNWDKSETYSRKADALYRLYGQLISEARKHGYEAHVNPYADVTTLVKKR